MLSDCDCGLLLRNIGSAFLERVWVHLVQAFRSLPEMGQCATVCVLPIPVQHTLGFFPLKMLLESHRALFRFLVFLTLEGTDSLFQNHSTVFSE